MSSSTSSTVDSSSVSARTEWRPALWSLLVGAILGCLAGLAAINQVHPLFPRPELPELGAYPSQELVEQHKFAELEFHRRNGAANCGLLGALMGLATAIFSAKRKLISGIASLLSGGVVGAGIGYVIGQVSANGLNNATEQSMVHSVLFHGAIFAAIGVAVWSSITLINKPTQLLAAVGFSILGGGLGAVIYNVVGSIAFPLSNLSIVTPNTSAERSIWVLSCAIGLAGIWGLGSRSNKASALSNNG